MGIGTTVTIAIIGSGTIGLSFAALHLTRDPHSKVIIYDPRPGLQAYIQANITSYLVNTDVQQCLARLHIAPTLKDAVERADVVQEQGPENLPFKRTLWPQIELHAPPHALFMSSTSGIPASQQCTGMKDPSRLLVVHPYNPPHIMPLLELVPSPLTSPTTITSTQKFFTSLARVPIPLQKETPGFVANRLAFALLREACSLVSSGVVSVKDLDSIVTSSMGPRWSVAGPFKSYHAGGGEEGLRGFMEKIGGTVGMCWGESERGYRENSIVVGEGTWQEEVCLQAEEAYGRVDTGERDRKTRRVLEVVGEREREVR
ncbi:hypothetical protein M409DRAFT_48388 [Zasmidium cellare ATCC 36951]|uniref:3-hydroxyacyl-CoA dehydrogenase NAD binding domain-containing protein n=1 Tax=Zasmidium cellare ATCC 36951 TaxID=1080233 RepID=A0A6A6D1V0_ZASCE|nr:uncharacterized protein M409DRAFT_48388 [Zasmidium cellare ATCC 36951]KAF2173404.1 hypothetical protein M409DRAFT_48388 [Zasmidium cellare ATCC 36951]